MSNIWNPAINPEYAASRQRFESRDLRPPSPKPSGPATMPSTTPSAPGPGSPPPGPGSPPPMSMHTPSGPPKALLIAGGLAIAGVAAWLILRKRKG